MLLLLKNLFQGLNELVTLGGASASRNALNALQDEEKRYLAYYKQAESHEAELREQLACIGSKLTAAQHTLEAAERALQQDFGRQAQNWHAPSPDMFDDIRRFQRNIQTSVAERRFMNLVGLSAGATTGGVVSVGSWALVASLGSASTGAAISGLSGVAATNATLAWFGGGAIAAGGFGMSTGSVVLALLAITPVIAFATWLTHKQARQFDMKREKLTEDRQQLEKSFHSVLIAKMAIRKKQLEISAFCDDFETKAQPLLQLLRPSGLRNWLKGRMPWLFGALQLTPEQLNAREQLVQSVHQFLKRLEVNQFI